MLGEAITKEKRIIATLRKNKLLVRWLYRKIIFLLYLNLIL